MKWRWLLGCVLMGGAGMLALGCSGKTKREGDPGSVSSAGSSGTSGAGGSSGSGPSNVFIGQIITNSATKLDLLFMIDNSTSMSDKQEILAQAVPQMVSRLVSPICVDDSGAPVGGTADASGNCANGHAEFAPLKDIHIAIVTSSLGSHGGDVCNSAVNADDLGQTLGSMRGIPGWNNSGFLAWDPGGNKNTPPGNETSADTLVSDFSNMVIAAGQVGCGYEASLEAWYRFLIDPEPPTSVAMQNGVTVKMGLNQTLLMQRSQFLRPDSVVAIVMLSDENDCSIADAGYGWFISTRTSPSGAENRMFAATHFCDTNPNDVCCMSCGDSSAPPAQCGFSSASQDSACQQSGGMLSPQDDSVALRCWDGKRRFGFDLMYPVERYTNALSQPTVCADSSGELGGSGCVSPVINPLFDANIGALSGATPRGSGARDSSQIFLAAIVGVPWQDLASSDTLSDPTRLRYLTADEMSQNDRWAVVLGDPKNASGPVLPSDPFMVETDLDRTTLPIPQANPILTSATLVPHTSTNPQANPINGHEQNVVYADDLQYACIFPLSPPKTCTNGMQGCDCSPSASGDTAPLASYNSPLCQPPSGGAPTATQTYAKAYPGLRFLQVLQGFGKNAIPASICPKITAQGQADFGYNPALSAIVERVKEGLTARCLPRALTTAPDPNDPAQRKQVSCAVVEASYVNGGSCPPCSAAAGRAGPNAKLVPAVVQQMQSTGQCDAPNGRACSDFCFCELLQESGAAADACRKDPIAAAADPMVPPGFCYISNEDDGLACASDADCRSGTCSGGACAPSAALAKCPANQQRELGFVSTAGSPTPVDGALLYLACFAGPAGG